MRPPHRRQSRRGPGWLAISFALLTASACGLVAGVMGGESLMAAMGLTVVEPPSLPGRSPKPPQVALLPTLSDSLNVLFMATDVDYTYKDGKRVMGVRGRTDTIMVLHTGRGPNVLMSIPRDSLVPIPGRGTTKINAAFAYGGPRLLTRTIEQNTGIHIDDYVEIGFNGLISLVDAVGGITICPKQAINDKLAELNIKKGCQEVDGKTALGYSRSRHAFALGDIARAQHQREVVSAIGKEVLSWKTIVNPIRYYRVVTGGAKSVRLGEGTGPVALGQFALAMDRVNGKDGLTCGVPIANLAVTWDPVRSKKLFTLIRENRAQDIGKRLCTPTGIAK